MQCLPRSSQGRSIEALDETTKYLGAREHLHIDAHDLQGSQVLLSRQDGSTSAVTTETSRAAMYNMGSPVALCLVG